jgi:hypothetical protein
VPATRGQAQANSFLPPPFHPAVIKLRKLLQQATYLSLDKVIGDIRSLAPDALSQAVEGMGHQR